MREAKRPTWTERMVELRRCGWYWGDLSWLEAETILENAPNGSYLARDSRSDEHLFTVSYIANGRIYHSRMNLFAGELHIGGPTSIQHSPSLVLLVNETLRRTQSGEMSILMHRKGEEANAEQLHLARPLSRFDRIPPLSYLCRAMIRERVPLAECARLPLARPLKDFLAEPRYLIPPLPELQILEERKKKKRRG